MHAVIMSAGRGSRMGAITKNLPKAFIDVAGKTIYERQLEALSSHVDKVTLVLGHGFRDVDCETREGLLDEHVRIPLIDEFDEVNIAIFGEWDMCENAGTFRLGLQCVEEDEHVMAICGDVIFREPLIGEVLETYRVTLNSDGHGSVPGGPWSAVTAIQGEQDQMTGVIVDEGGRVTDYGAIDGSHQETGIFILHPEYRKEARVYLRKGMEGEWFPYIFQDPYIPSQIIWVDEDQRAEINTVSHLREAKEKAKRWEAHEVDEQDFPSDIETRV